MYKDKTNSVVVIREFIPKLIQSSLSSKALSITTNSLIFYRDNQSITVSDPRYSNILEIMKNAAENVNARRRIESYRNHVNILALRPFVLTSNYVPRENDTGFKRRLKSIYFDKNDAH